MLRGMKLIQHNFYVSDVCLILTRMRSLILGKLRRLRLANSTDYHSSFHVNHVTFFRSARMRKVLGTLLALHGFCLSFHVSHMIIFRSARMRNLPGTLPVLHGFA